MNNENLLKGYVETLNKMIEILRENGTKIKDANDLEWELDYIYYSPAQDEVLFKCK